MAGAVVVDDHVDLLSGLPPRAVEPVEHAAGQLPAAQIGDQLGAVVAVEPGPAVGAVLRPTGSQHDR